MELPIKVAVFRLRVREGDSAKRRKTGPIVREARKFHAHSARLTRLTTRIQFGRWWFFPFLLDLNNLNRDKGHRHRQEDPKLISCMHFSTLNAGRGICIGLFCIAVSLCAVTAPAQLAFGTELNDATMDAYHGVQHLGRIHITRAYMDHERFGFFRLGLVLVPVVEGVQIQIRSAESLTNVLDSLESANGSSAKLRRLEFRNVEISLLSDRSPRLHAEKARLIAPNTLELSHVSLSSAAQGAVTISRATLQVSGPGCGLLSWNDKGNSRELPVFKP